LKLTDGSCQSRRSAPVWKASRGCCWYCSMYFGSFATSCCWLAAA
jgi:hypothetical protein